MMENQRPSFDLDLEDDDIDISQVSSQRKVDKKIDKVDADDTVLRKTAEQSGFVSRQPTRRRKRTVYTEQMNFKCRPGMKELIQSIGEELDIRDCETIERAILSLIESEKLAAHKARFDEITGKKGM